MLFLLYKKIFIILLYNKNCVHDDNTSHTVVFRSYILTKLPLHENHKPSHRYDSPHVCARDVCVYQRICTNHAMACMRRTHGERVHRTHVAMRRGIGGRVVSPGGHLGGSRLTSDFGASVFP